jgi:N-acetylglucosamine kinase-like BadF-type ATPase
VADRLSADLPGPDTVLALDGGNSKTDVVLLTAHGEVLARARCGPFLPNVAGAVAAVGSIGSAVHEVLRCTADGRAGHLAAYMAGADLPEQTEAIRVALLARGWTDTAVVDNDTFALLRAGTERDFGVAVVCGAGINCLGVAPDGTHLRFPALGRITGDWGGGLELAEEVLWWAARAEDGRGVETALASAAATHFGTTDATSVAAGFHLGTLPAVRMHELVTLLFATAENGDPVAGSVVLRQVEEIVLLVSTTIRRLRMEDTVVDVVLGGGILAARDRVLTEPLTARLRDTVPTARPTFLTTPPVVGAGLLGLEQLWGRRSTPDPTGLGNALRRARAGIGADLAGARSIPTGAP